MEQILYFDWKNVQPERERYFLKAEDLENCVTEKILRNSYHDPLISSSDDEEPTEINWDEVFRKKQNDEKHHQLFVPGIRGVPKYPRLSSLTPVQHTQLLKVICASNPHILPQKTFPRPTKVDYKHFEELKLEYEKEKQEFMAWAKSLWTKEHCIRALRPKPAVELVYEAQFKLRAHELQCYPKYYTLAAQIPLENINNRCEMIYCNELVPANFDTLAQTEFENIEKKISIIKAIPTPEPCDKHPCKFILPRENSVSILPLTEIEVELAQYAVEQGAQYITSESALKCLLTLDQTWYIPIRVCEVIDSSGEKSNVAVLGSEFAVKKESAMQRTYKAFRHLLEDALIPLSEKAKLLRRKRDTEDHNDLDNNSMDILCLEPSSDDEDNNLCIDIDDDLKIIYNASETGIEKEENLEYTNTQSNDSKKDIYKKKNSMKKIGFYECTCKDTVFENPPPRSFKKWRVRSKTLEEQYDIIVHCAHKTRNKTEEVVVEPIPEYQLECGAVSLSREKIASLALSLYLRQKASLLNVRIDGSSGEIVTMQKWNLSEFTKTYGDMLPYIANVLHSTLNQLQGLLPGHYILQHEPSHGANALLYSPRASGADTLVLDLDVTTLAQSDQSAEVRVAPTLCDDLLPVHKFRRTLPCAFTPYQDQLPKQPRRPGAPNKTPPQAIKSSAARGRKRGKRRGGRSRT